MIRRDQTSSKHQPTSKKDQKDQIVKVETDRLNSKFPLNFKEVLINYPRWVQDTPKNRIALKRHLARSAIYRGRSLHLMKYLPCCNLFFIEKKAGHGHKAPVKANFLLLTEAEKKEIRKFIKGERKKRPDEKYSKFKADLVPDVIELIQGFELTKIDSFIDSLPKKDGCFEFPLIRSNMTQSCVENELNKESRLGKVKKRHDLVFNPVKVQIKSELSDYSLGADQAELSPTEANIRSFLTSSPKKLKTEGMEGSPSKPAEDMRSDWNIKKKTSEAKRGATRRENPPQNYQINVLSQEGVKLDEVDFKDQGNSKPSLLTRSYCCKRKEAAQAFFRVPPPITTEQPEYFLRQPQNESSEMSFFAHNSQDQVDLDGTLDKKYGGELGEKPFHPHASFQDQLKDSDAYNELEIEENHHGCNSVRKPRFSNSRATKLEELKRLLAIKKEEEARSQNRVIEVEEQAAKAETKVLQAEKAWLEAENHLKEILSESSVAIEKTDKISQEVQDLESEIRELSTEMEIESFKIDD